MGGLEKLDSIFKAAVQRWKLLVICMINSYSDCRVTTGEKSGSCSQVVALKMKRSGLTLTRDIGDGSGDRPDERERGLPGQPLAELLGAQLHHFLKSSFMRQAGRGGGGGWWGRDEDERRWRARCLRGFWKGNARWKLEACDRNVHDNIISSPRKVRLFGCHFPSGEQNVEPGHRLSLVKNGLPKQETRNAEVADMHQRKCPFTIHIDFAPACASKCNSEISDMMVHRHCTQECSSWTGKKNNFALHKPWSAFSVDTFTFLTWLGKMTPYHYIRQTCSNNRMCLLSIICTSVEPISCANNYTNIPI